MNPKKKGTFKFSPPENPYDNRTLEAGKTPPRTSPDGRDVLPANLLSVSQPSSPSGSKKPIANPNIKRAESAADNNAYNAKYQDYDKFSSEAAIPERDSPEGSFVPNQPRVYRPSKDLLKEDRDQSGASADSKKRLHEKAIHLKSGETLTPKSAATPPRGHLTPSPVPRSSRSPSPAPRFRHEPTVAAPETGPPRPKDLEIPPFPEDGYSPFERLPSKPSHKVPAAGVQDRRRVNGVGSPVRSGGMMGDCKVPVGSPVCTPEERRPGGMTGGFQKGNVSGGASPVRSPDEQKHAGVMAGQKVNSSWKVQQGMYQAKLGEVPQLQLGGVPPLPERKNFPGQLKPPLVDSDSSSEPSDSPPAAPRSSNRVSYTHTDPGEDEGGYLDPISTTGGTQPVLTLAEFNQLKKREVRTWDYSESSSYQSSDSDDSSSVDSFLQKPRMDPSRKAPLLPKRAMELEGAAEERLAALGGSRVGASRNQPPDNRHPSNANRLPEGRRAPKQEARNLTRKAETQPPTAQRTQKYIPPPQGHQGRLGGGGQSPRQHPRGGGVGVGRPQSELVQGSEVIDRSAVERHRKVSDWHEVNLERRGYSTVPKKRGGEWNQLTKADVDGLRSVGSPSNSRKGRGDRKSKHQKMLSGGNVVKMPRTPRPKRMIIILEFLKKGVVNCVELHRRKLGKMKLQLNEGQGQGRTRQGLHYNLEKQMKSTERHLRKLEFHLAKVEELQEHYETELKLREGAENILRAFSDANSSKAKVSVSETKQRVKDCTQNMCHLEAELEVNLGVFIMKIEGIAGFARVCRGDVFEISFKYGVQKWKSKCKVEKDLSQTWENAEVMFFPMLADFLQIKVTEIRGIARSNIIIGSLEFDTSDFYQAEPQNLTIDVNEAGTIKLNVVISWSPFQIIEEDQRNKNSYGRRERAYTESSIQNLKSQPAAVPHSHRPQLSPTPSSLQPSERLDLDDVPMLTLAEALHNVNRLLEILNGQYVELRSLEKQVAALESYLRKKCDIERQESIASLSIKNALDSFNFLDEVDEGLSDDEGDLTEETNRQNHDDDPKAPVPKSKSLDHLGTTSPSVTSKSDRDGPSSISASRPELRLGHRQDRPSGKRSSRFLELSEKRESRMLEVNEQRSSGVLLDSPTTVDSSFGSLGRSSGIDTDSEPLSTGSESIDLVLIQHLMYTEYQLSHLGAFGPLKLKETIALDKLQKQAVIIEQLVMLSSSGDEFKKADEILPELKLNPPLLEFWDQCSEKHSLYVNADLFLLQLDVKFGVKLRTNHPDIADDVFQSLGHRIIERPIDLLDPKAIITLFQYITFFAQEDRKNPERFINDLTNEFELTASLEPGNPDLPKIVKKLPKGALLPTGNLRALSLLLLEESDTIKNGVKNYLESICINAKSRQKAIHVYSECLEERDLSLRQAGCVALAAMRARESLDQLVYLLRCDMDDVKQTAKEALMTFGEDGRQACQSWNVQQYHQPPPPQQQRSEGPLLTTEL